jgi:hypothetical protein
VRAAVGLDGAEVALVVAATLAVVLLAVFVQGQWLGIFGAAATVIGLSVAVGQIRLARAQIEQAVSVAEATRQAITTTRSKMVRNELQDSIPRAQEVDRSLNAALVAKDPAEVANALADWRDRAYGVWSLIDGGSYASKGLTDALLGSAKRAAELRSELPDDPTELQGVTVEIRAEISGACGLLEALKTKLKLETGEDL